MFQGFQKKNVLGFAFGLAIVVASVSFAAKTGRLEDIISYNYETMAENVPVVRPQTADEVGKLIREAARDGKQIRFSGSSHSTSSVILGSGTYLKSSGFNQIDGITVDPVFGPVVQVESGVKLGELATYVAQHGYALGFGYPFYDGLTIGGLLSTGAHGSSRRHTALSSDNVIEMILINGKGEQVTIDSATPEALKAARVSLGLLGFIYKVKLKLVPDFNIEFRSTTLVGPSALLAEAGSVNWGEVADSEYIFWFPKYDRAVKVEGTITNKRAWPGAQSVVLGESNEGGLRDHVNFSFLKWGKDSTTVNGKIEDSRFDDLSTSPPPYVYLDRGEYSRAQGVVGPSAKMLISKSIPLNPVYTTQDFSFAFRIENAPEVMRKIHEFCDKNEFYHPFIGVFLRFARSSGSSYLSFVEHQDGRGDGIYVLAEFFEAKAYSQSDPPTKSSRMRDQLLSELAASGLVTFHWGKNVDGVFVNQANRNVLGQNIVEFEKVRKTMDPSNVFQNAFARQFVGP